jgi:hypothetical protein
MEVLQLKMLDIQTTLVTVMFHGFGMLMVELLQQTLMDLVQL